MNVKIGNQINYKPNFREIELILKKLKILSYRQLASFLLLQQYGEMGQMGLLTWKNHPPGNMD